MRMARLRGILRSRRGDDSGFGLMLVIGTSTIVSALVVLAATMAVRSLTSSREHVNFEGSIAAAEAGIDAALARTQQAYDATGADTYNYPAPSDAACPVATPDWAASGGPGAAGSTSAAVAAERRWAKATLLTIAAYPGCRARGPQGEFVFFKPVGHSAVYAMGWAPAYGADRAKMRYLKAEYLFTPYSPTNAVLTGGDLEIDSSTTITTAPPNSPLLAEVHANGAVVVGGGNPHVDGIVSQSAEASLTTSNKFLANAGGAVQRTVQEGLPFVSAMQVWAGQHQQAMPGGWYDLCADGTARSPDGAAPCTGTTLATVDAGGSFRGWTFDGTGAVVRWRATSAIKQNGYSGVYFVAGGDVVVDAGNSGNAVPNLTVIAAAQGSGCGKVGGSIDWNQIDVAAPAVPNLFLLADADLRTGSNFHAGSASGATVVSGLFIAGDQVEMQTSSAGVYGAVLAGDQCHPGSSLVGSNVVKNPTLYYDPNAKAPFVGLVNTTLWLEYTGD